jgi:hypothetical protein
VGRFVVEQPIGADPDAVQAAFCSAELYEALSDLPDIAPPEVLERTATDGVVHLRVRYRFNGSLAPAVRAVIDPAKLTWVDDSTIDVAARRTRWEIQPEHYARNLQCGGEYSFLPAGEGRTTQRLEANLRVRWPLVGGLVERAILSGLRQHLAAEAPIVERFVRERS